jgi:hypothetical protein
MAASGLSVRRASFLSRGLHVRTPIAVYIFLDRGRDGTGVVSSTPLVRCAAATNSEDLGMNNQLRTLPRTLGVAALLAQSLVFFACSSSSPDSGTGGQTGASQGGATGSQGGSSGGLGGDTGGAGSSGMCAQFPGSCTCTGANPDSVTGGACADGCQSVSCGLPCMQDCCVPCGLDSAGTKTCTCTMPGLAYTNCSCLPPTGFPAGLTGGACSPQGYAATTPPATAPAGSISLKGVPCTKLNTVCFTADSTAASERGCICMSDNTMHCGSVNHWFTNSGATATTY